MAQRAYGAARPLRTPRATEYELFAEITAGLVRAQASSEARGGGAFPALADAVQRNRKLWTVLAVQVADPANALPAPLRAQLFYLSQFVDQHSRAVLNGGDPEPLVEINRTVMIGLRPQGTAPGAAA